MGSRKPSKARKTDVEQDIWARDEAMLNANAHKYSKEFIAAMRNLIRSGRAMHRAAAKATRRGR